MERTFFISFLFFTCFSTHGQQRFSYNHQQMGTQIGLVFYAPDKVKADSVALLAFNRIDTLNEKFSDYIDNSELNLLSAQANKAVQVSDDLFRILKMASEISENTDGAFDISAGPLVQLWRNTRESQILPSESALENAMQNTGYKYLEFPKKNVVRLKASAMQLDLGGIGKGFVADEVIKILELNGVTSALIDMGGDIRVSDPPPTKEHWVLALSFFNIEGKEVIKKLGLKNAAVATSGDMYQFVEIEGKKYSHIINPQTGMALSNRIQVTTIAKDATSADAYASAFSVMELRKIKDHITEFPNLEIFRVSKTGGNYQNWHSPGFNRFEVRD